MEVITSHIQADFDAFASMIAARLLYPEAKLVFPGAQEKGLRQYLEHAAPNVTADIVKLKNLALEQITRLIIVDTRQLSRIGPFAQVIERAGVEVHIYDHHPASADDITGHEIHSRELGSNVALMVELLRQRDIPPPADLATVMALGIYEDTGCLLFPSTRPEDCTALAQLITWGADLKEVARSISRELNPEQVGLLDQMIRNVATMSIGGSDILITTCEATHYVEDFAMLVHKIGGMYAADALFACARMGERVYLVARSALPQIDASQVVAHFGGGGHPSAAAASIKGLALENVKAQLVQAIRKEARPRITARDIMTFPVKALGMQATIDEASVLLNRYHINAALVQARDGRVVGLVTRQVVSRAQGHGLGRAPVKDYMIRDIRTVHGEAPISEIRALIIDGSQRLLPVVEDDRPVGVITRTDLMLVMHAKMATIERLDQKDAPGKVVKTLLRERLPDDFCRLLHRAGELAESMGFRIFLVGGIVRDMFLRIDNLDVDLVVEGDGIRFARSFAEGIAARVAAHDKYKTAVLTLGDGRHIDVATARVEYYKAPGGFPVVEESTLKLDLYRRDFTINTMAIALNPPRFGQLIDFFGALRDIKEKKVRVLHSLSFVEDPSRILRAVRFEQRYGFSLGKQTLSLVHSAVKAGFLKGIPGRRISHEMVQLLSEEDPSPGMERLRDLGVLEAIHPDLSFSPGVRDTFARVRETVLWFSLLYTHERLSVWFLYLLALIDHLKPKKIIAIGASLGLSDNEIRRMLAAKDGVNEILKAFATKQDKVPAWVVQTIEGASLEVILFAMSKTRSREVKEKISSYVTTWRHYRPPVTGQDLIAIGFRQGRFLGDCLKSIREKGLNGEIRDFSEALAFAREFLMTGGGSAKSPG